MVAWSGSVRGTADAGGTASAGGHVVVDGWGLLADELVTQLRRCDVTVRGGRHAADGAELALATGEDPPRAVVVVSEGRTPRWAAAPWQARRIPHLPVVLGSHAVVIGPLVLPGRTACLRCAEPDRLGSRVCGPDDIPSGTVVLACAVATVTVLSTLRGDTSLGGISTEIGLAEVSVTHRLWNVRPGCGCARVRMAG